MDYQKTKYGSVDLINIHRNPTRNTKTHCGFWGTDENERMYAFTLPEKTVKHSPDMFKKRFITIYGEICHSYSDLYTLVVNAELL